MQRHFDYLKVTRDNIQSKMDGLSMEQLNLIPEGFNNNLIWNYGHVIITQQLLCYKLSGLDINIDKSLVDLYRKGSKPDHIVDLNAYNYLKEQLYSTVDQTIEDHKAGIFKEYHEYTTSYNATLTSIEDAILFNNMHEAMHLGAMIAIHKFV